MRNALIQIEDQMVHSNWIPDIVLGINRGGCIPGVYLSHRLKRPHEVLDVRLRDHTATPNLDVLEKLAQKQNKILIIDDINDTGATFRYILDKFGKTKNIKFAAVINNKPSPVQWTTEDMKSTKMKILSGLYFLGKSGTNRRTNVQKLVKRC